MLRTRHLKYPIKTVRRAGQLLHLHLSAFKRARDGASNYRGDPRFHRDFVEQGFRPRNVSSQLDEELLHRICKAYQAAVQATSAMEYEPTEWWEAVRHTSLQPVLRALNTEDVGALQPMYANFLRDPCSDGLGGKSALLTPSHSRPFTRTHQWAYLSETLMRIDTWKMLTNGRFGLHELKGPDVGNPYGVVLEGLLVRPGAELNHYCACRIAGLLQDKDAVVAEIGGGYGEMAYYLLRDRGQTRYVNFDLPESLALAAYYLIKSFPEKRILLYGETSTRDIGTEDFDIALLPLHELDAMPSRFADLLFSSHAMSDLAPEALSEYLALMNGATKRYFLCESVYPAAERVQRMISDLYPQFVLKAEKRFDVHGQYKRFEDLQKEILYERHAAGN